MKHLPSINSLMIIEVLTLVPPLITLLVFIPGSAIFSELKKQIYLRESRQSSFLSSVQTSKDQIGTDLSKKESLGRYKNFTDDVASTSLDFDAQISGTRRLSNRHRVIRTTLEADAIEVEGEIELQKM